MKNLIITEEQFKNIVSKADNLTEDSDNHYMAKQQLFTIATLAYKMWEMLEEGQELDDWMESKIAQCDDSITSVVKAFMYGDVTDSQKGMDTLNYDDLIIGT